MSTKAELHEQISQLTREHLESIGGGLSCSSDDLVTISESIVTVYENLVDATSHIIQRVLGS